MLQKISVKEFLFLSAVVIQSLFGIQRLLLPQELSLFCDAVYTPECLGFPRNAIGQQEGIYHLFWHSPRL